ncbi:Sodium/myo-inositol cotransporter 2-like 1, partial [Homarus americanus]
PRASGLGRHSAADTSGEELLLEGHSSSFVVGDTMAEVDGVGGSRLTWPDFVVITVYFLCVLIVGIWSSRKNKKDSISSYFLASRNLHWIPVGASLFASNIGSGHFIGLAGAGAASGLAAHGYEQAADLYAGALFIQLALNKSSDEWLYISVFFLLGVAAVFTIVGGLTTVVYTDLVQMVLMVMGSLVLMVKSFHAVGGYYSLVERFPYAKASIRAMGVNNKSCGEVPPDYMSLLRTLDPSKSEYPWVGMTFGMASI